MGLIPDTTKSELNNAVALNYYREMQAVLQQAYS